MKNAVALQRNSTNANSWFKFQCITKLLVGWIKLNANRFYVKRNEPKKKRKNTELFLVVCISEILILIMEVVGGLFAI